MPPRSTIDQIDKETRAELNRRLVASGFGNYRGHAEWLASRGCNVGKSALQRYASRLRQHVGEGEAHPIVLAAEIIAGAIREAASRNRNTPS